MEEDWDAEISETAAPAKQFQSMTIQKSNDSPASKYFDDDYQANDRDEGFNGFGSHVNFGATRGRGRGRFGRYFFFGQLALSINI